jgi:hypothetical protein
VRPNCAASGPVLTFGVFGARPVNRPGVPRLQFSRRARIDPDVLDSERREHVEQRFFVEPDPLLARASCAIHRAMARHRNALPA